MKKNKVLDQCDFMVMLRTSLQDQDPARLDNAYDQFLTLVERISGSKKSYIEKLRLLTRTSESLERIKGRIRNQTSACYLYAQSAGSILSFEKRALLLQLKYPALNENKRIRRKPPFRLSKEYTPTDLMEIITMFHAVGFFCLYDDSPVSLTKLTDEFEVLCGVKIKNPDNARWAILNRKTKLTHCIDIMRNALIDLSRK